MCKVIALMGKMGKARGITQGKRFSRLRCSRRRKSCWNGGKRFLLTAVSQSQTPYSPAEQNFFSDRHAEHLLQIPLVAGNSIVGLLTIYRTAEQASFNQRDSRFAQAMAVQTAVSLQNATLAHRTRTQVNRLNSLNRISRDLSAAQSLREMYETIRAQLLPIVNATGCLHFTGQRRQTTRYLELPLRTWHRSRPLQHSPLAPEQRADRARLANPPPPAHQLPHRYGSVACQHRFLLCWRRDERMVGGSRDLCGQFVGHVGHRKTKRMPPRLMKRSRSY
jgi:hypothetical protein